MQFSGEDLERMMAEMADAQKSITEIETQRSELSATATSKDRLVSATVDAQGALSALKLTGQSWREMSAKELTTKVVDVVTQAQSEVAQRNADLIAGLSPEGLEPMTGLPEGVDMETMMRGLIGQFGSVQDDR